MLRRAALLALLSVALVNFPYYELHRLQVHGTLMRIAWCYLLAALVFAHTRWPLQLALIGALLLAQWAALTWIAVPGAGAGVFTPEGNASSYLDRLLFGDFTQRLFAGMPVSQGLLPSAGAVATTLCGVVAGAWLTRDMSTARRNRPLVLCGVLLCGLGMVWSAWLPLSKPLWTGSFVVFMTGITLLLLAALSLGLRFRALRPLGTVLQVAGANALFFYLFAQGLQRILVYARFRDAAGNVTQLREWLYAHLILPWNAGPFGALVYTLAFLALCYGVVLVLYRRRIFIKL